jgi:hypothetical protein
VATVRTLRLTRGTPRAGRGMIERDFPFRGNSAANKLRNYREKEILRALAQIL